MCVYSMVADHYRDMWQPRPWYSPATEGRINLTIGETITREEFDALKKEVADLKGLLVRAKEYDERNGEPDCEMDEKVAILRKVAQLVGVDLADALPKEAAP